MLAQRFKVAVLLDNNAEDDHSKFDIIISTPLKLVQSVGNKKLSLDKVQYLVLDEADRLFELGFLEDVDKIIAECKKSASVNIALFSATIPSGVEALARTVMTNEIRISIGLKNSATTEIEQQLLYVGSEEGKLLAMRQLINEGLKPPILVFVQSIDRARDLFHELIYAGVNVEIIHSSRSQKQRESVVKAFRQGKIWVLIATDLLARGLDFKGVQMVINYDFPQSSSSYIHRIGRTGRAGRSGKAITYVTKDDTVYLKSVLNVMEASGCKIPEWMTKLKRVGKNAKKRLRLSPPERKPIAPKQTKRLRGVNLQSTED